MDRKILMPQYSLQFEKTRVDTKARVTTLNSGWLEQRNPPGQQIGRLVDYSPGEMKDRGPLQPESRRGQRKLFLPECEKGRRRGKRSKDKGRRSLRDGK